MKKSIIVFWVLLIIGGGYYFYYVTHLVNCCGPDLPSTENTYEALNEADANYKEISATFEKTYSEAKKELLSKGWITYIPQDFKSAGDKQFPEIGNCGNGIDAVCFVNLKKGNIIDHIDVQVGGRPPYGPYKEWTVVGST